MKLDKAIEIKELYSKGYWPADNPDVKKADALSIEAMKRLELTRRGSIIAWHTLLPGETKDPKYFEYQAKDELPPNNQRRP